MSCMCIMGLRPLGRGGGQGDTTSGTEISLFGRWPLSTSNIGAVYSAAPPILALPMMGFAKLTGEAARQSSSAARPTSYLTLVSPFFSLQGLLAGQSNAQSFKLFKAFEGCMHCTLDEAFTRIHENAPRSVPNQALQKFEP